MIRRRYRRIVFFFARILLSFAYWDIVLPRLGFGKRSKKNRPERLQRSAIAFRKLAIEMGGVMIKVGQFLSSRVDILPQEFTDELTGLQDEVPAEDIDEIRKVAEAEFDMPLREKYSAFEEIPLAAASLGQVHRAKIRSKSILDEPESARSYDVVVKIQRPNIENLIATDLAALRTVGNWLSRYRPISRRADIPALLDEFTRILYEEIDYLAEGRNAETFAVNFKGDQSVRVPIVLWSHTTKRVLTLENVWAIKITDYEAITAAGIDRAEVASKLLDTYFKQIFEDGFFHADPHPGNLFVYPLRISPSKGDQISGRPWKLTFVDFGMVSRVPPNTKEALREMLIGVGTRDSARVVKSYQMLDVLLPGANLELLEKAESKVFDHFWGKSMSELQQISPEEVSEFTSEFRELIYTMPFQIPQDIVFLARAVGILSGICTGLNPDINVWEHLAPYAQKLMLENGEDIREQWFDEIREIAKSIITLPIKFDRVIGKLEKGEVAVRTSDLDIHISRLDTSIKQLLGGIIFAVFMLGGIQLYISDHVTIGLVFMGIGGATLLWIIIKGRKRSGGSR